MLRTIMIALALTLATVACTEEPPGTDPKQVEVGNDGLTGIAAVDHFIAELGADGSGYDPSTRTYPFGRLSSSSHRKSLLTILRRSFGPWRQAKAA